MWNLNSLLHRRG